MSKVILTIKNVNDVLQKDIIIAADSKTGKRFVYTPYIDEYTIYIKDKYVDVGDDLIRLLEVYNNI